MVKKIWCVFMPHSVLTNNRQRTCPARHVLRTLLINAMFIVSWDSTSGIEYTAQWRRLAAIARVAPTV